MDKHRRAVGRVVVVLVLFFSHSMRHLLPTKIQIESVHHQNVLLELYYVGIIFLRRFFPLSPSSHRLSNEP